jgi:predicted ATPase/DNA-binding CsgD family transcriptional regulator
MPTGSCPGAGSLLVTCEHLPGWLRRYCCVVGGVVASVTQGLPRARTTFVGRADQVAEVARLLDEFQVVTVTGPGGVGKTRLAIEVAWQVSSRFADGVFVIELAAVTDAEMVPAAVAAGMGVQQESGKSVTEALAAALARQQVLVVLDNCEHLVDSVADLCGALLAVADDARLLVTSREPMRVAAEVRYRLQPLPVTVASGGPDQAWPAALTLFADRARQVEPHFSLDAESWQQAAKLVARLDGMPLAIELAAARVDALGLAQLLDRLEESFGLLTDGYRTAPPRQRSLAAAVEWSYQLLDEPGRRAFRRLAVIPGPFTLDAAAAVAGAATEPVVLHLVDCSLLAPPRTGEDGRIRYLMLETLRAFGRDELTRHQELAQCDAALASYALTVAEQAADGMTSSGGEQAAIRWLDAEDGILRQALAWAMEHDLSMALRLGTSLAPWWNLRGRSAEGYAQLHAAVTETEPKSKAWCAGQYWLGQLAVGAGNMATGLEHYTAAVGGLVTDAPSALLADALAGRANTLINLAQISEGTGEAHRALALSRELGYPAGEVFALQCLTAAAFYADDFDEALRWAYTASAVDPETVPDEFRRGCANFLTMALIEAGDLDAARENCQAALSLARDTADLQAEAFTMRLKSELSLRAGQLAVAWSDLAAALRLAARTGDTFRLSSCLSVGGELCAAAGKWAEAVTVWTADMVFLRDSGLTERARTVRSREESMRRAAQELDAQRTATAQQRGAAMTVEVAGEYLLLLADAGSEAPSTGRPTWAAAELSARERELVTLVARGETDAQIAAHLFISVSTVRSHLDRIRDKTGCRRRADLTRLALQTGLV